MLKKVSSVLATTALISSGAFAKHHKGHSGRLDYRAEFQRVDNDYLPQRQDSEAGNYAFTNTDPNFSGFSLQRARLDFKGPAKAGWHYRARFRLTNPLTNTATDNSGAGLDMAYVKKEVHKNVWMKLGKQRAVYGASMMNISSGDRYLVNPVNSNVEADLRYATGVMLAYKDKKSGNKVGFQFLNGPTTDTAALNSSGTTTSKQKNYKANFFYHGNFMNGMLKPTLSWTRMPQPGHTGNDTVLSAGLGIHHGMWTINADWTDYAQEYETINTGDSNKLLDDEQDSWGVKVGYNAGKWRPFARYFAGEYDKGEVTGGLSQDYDFTGWVAAIEYYPETKSSFRYHVAYTGLDTDWKTTGARDSEQFQLFAGVRGMFDLF